jgi:hypothetical protein
MIKKRSIVMYNILNIAPKSSAHDHTYYPVDDAYPTSRKTVLREDNYVDENDGENRVGESRARQHDPPVPCYSPAAPVGRAEKTGVHPQRKIEQLIIAKLPPLLTHPFRPSLFFFGSLLVHTLHSLLLQQAAKNTGRCRCLPRPRIINPRKHYRSWGREKTI